MLSGKIGNKIDQVWNTFRTGFLKTYNFLKRIVKAICGGRAYFTITSWIILRMALCPLRLEQSRVTSLI